MFQVLKSGSGSGVIQVMGSGSGLIQVLKSGSESGVIQVIGSWSGLFQDLESGSGSGVIHVIGSWSRSGLIYLIQVRESGSGSRDSFRSLNLDLDPD